jgi:hypothetical protein
MYGLPQRPINREDVTGQAGATSDLNPNDRFGATRMSAADPQCSYLSGRRRWVRRLEVNCYTRMKSSSLRRGDGDTAGA